MAIPGAELLASLAALDLSHSLVVTYNMTGEPADLRHALAAMRDMENLSFVSAADLVTLVDAPTVRVEPGAVARSVLDDWRQGPPDFVEVDGTPLSLADAFVALAKGFSGDGAVQVSPVLGPLGDPGDLVQAAGHVSAGEVLAAGIEVAASLSGGALPLNVRVGSAEVGFHQFLYLMAKATITPTGQLQIPDADHAPPFARWLTTAMRRPNQASNFWVECQYWTIKPVVWR